MSSSFGQTSYSKQEFQQISNNLNKQLGPEYLSERSGPGNTKLKYLEGWKLANLANEILGFNGWSHSIISQTVDYVDFQEGKYSIGISTVVRVTLKDGSYHEDCGYGSIENCRQKAAAFEKAKKESVTDALKRTLKHFGNALGNCIYSKDYLKKIGKMRNPPPTPLDSSALYRAQEVQEKKPEIQSKVVDLDPNYDDSYFDDDVLLAADLECISADFLQDNTEVSRILPDSFMTPNQQANSMVFDDSRVLTTNNQILPPSLTKPPSIMESRANVAIPNKSFQKSFQPPKPFVRSRSSPK